MKPAIANSLWLASSLPAWARFRRVLGRPAETQIELLRGYLARNARTAFGRARGFAEIKTYREFAEKVPMADYDGLKPWIARMMRGEDAVLTAGRVSHLVPTSGSSAARKLIPFTAGLQREFNRAIAAWTTDLYMRHPSIIGGAAYWSISPGIQIEAIEPSAVPVGFDDDSAYLGGAGRLLLDAVMAAPPELRLIANMELFRYVTLLCLLRQAGLRLISIWHPSFLSLLLDALPAVWGNLLDDIARGRCRNSDSLSPAVLAALRLSPMARRSRELANADPARPGTIWPHLKIISCWGDGHARLAKDYLARRFPSVLVQSKGLLATEACVTIPFSGAHPLAVCSHFFEFIDGRGGVCMAHELKAGGTYEVVVTTGGGLWRYRLGDQVEVTDFMGATPSLRFVGRARNISDRFGEKISEAFAARVVREATAGMACPRFALLAPDESGGGWCYTLYIEGDAHPQIAERLERALCENPHYQWCRQLGQLQPARIFSISAGGYETFAAREIARGRRLGEIKPCALSGENDWSGRFNGGYAELFNDCFTI